MSVPNPHELSLLPALGDGPGSGLPAGGVELEFRAIEEPEPGERWRDSFNAMWPAYRSWYLKEGESARPDLATCRRMLADSMPELVPTFERLVALAGGDPLAARFLSMYRPPGFVVGCSQAAFTGDGGPALIRNYDYPASRLERIVYSTSWTGRRVMGMRDCLWGLLDGINDAGLAASLTFGGRPKVGDGFGIPLVIRYLLEVCENVTEACAVLERVPVHAAQNVTVLDRSGDLATVRVGPGRESEVLNVPVGGHQPSASGRLARVRPQRRHVWTRAAPAGATRHRRDERRPTLARLSRSAAVPLRGRRRARDAVHRRVLSGRRKGRVPLPKPLQQPVVHPLCRVPT